MITYITKRDGTKQPWDSDKAAGWGEWAAKELGGLVNWPAIVLNAMNRSEDGISSRQFQLNLIDECLSRKSWAHYRMAGRLYAALMKRDIYGKNNTPTVRELHLKLQGLGYMAKLDYTLEEYEAIEKFVDHDRDFGYVHFQLHHIRSKYAIQNRKVRTEYETPQFVYMRMAMALAEGMAGDRVYHVGRIYEHLSRNRINAPTPNFINLGTNHNGYASCCLYTANDTAASLAIGDHIGYMMTVMSAGIGTNIRTRSLGDPIRGGMIVHNGKLPYYRAKQGAVTANKQAGRSGACTTFFPVFDPEIDTLLRLKNPMTVEDKRIRGLDYTTMANRFFAYMVSENKDIFLFNPYSAPDLVDAFYSGDLKKFVTLYHKYENDPDFEKTYVNARDTQILQFKQIFETGRAYLAFMDEINRHTPFKDPIFSSNLCLEITEPTWGYERMEDLYADAPCGYVIYRLKGLNEPVRVIAEEGFRIIRKSGDNPELSFVDAAQNFEVGDVVELLEHSGDYDSYLNGEIEEIIEVKRESEVALCSLGAIVISNIVDDEMYDEVMYYTLYMIDVCIHKSHYALPHLGYTAKKRLNAGVGIMDLGHYLARRRLKYSSKAGKEEMHRVAERHMFFAVKNSLRLGRELGNAPWMHRTKWADGWLPIDTYNKGVDSIVDVPLQYDWEALRAEVKANQGIRNSVLVAHMPGESSSKASGCMNGLYPARELAMLKTDANVSVWFAVNDSDRIGRHYEMVWDIPTKDMIDCYAIFQKFCDQAISADLYHKFGEEVKIGSSKLLEEYLYMVDKGMKTRYYVNSHTSNAISLNAGVKKNTPAPATTAIADEIDCENCKM